MLNNSIYIVFILIACFANSQVNTNSPYSFYGLGNISQTGFSQNEYKPTELIKQINTYFQQGSKEKAKFTNWETRWTVYL